jgi:antitoxin CcdA
MIRQKVIRQMVNVNNNVECDVCHKSFDTETDIFETQEFLYINFRGGYGSVFGDGNKVQCEICQHCLKELLGKYLRIEED